MFWNQGNLGWDFGNVLIMAIVCFSLAVAAGIGVWVLMKATRVDKVSLNATFESARTVLDRRFANGDLDVESYARARLALEMKSNCDERSL